VISPWQRWPCLARSAAGGTTRSGVVVPFRGGCGCPWQGRQQPAAPGWTCGGDRLEIIGFPVTNQLTNPMAHLSIGIWRFPKMQGTPKSSMFFSDVPLQTRDFGALAFMETPIFQAKLLIWEYHENI